MLEITPHTSTQICTRVLFCIHHRSEFLETESQTSDVVVQLKDFSHTSVLKISNGTKKEIEESQMFQTEPLF